MDSVGSVDGRSYNVIPHTMGTEMVCLRGISVNTTQKLGDFLISDSVAINDRALYYEVVKIGSDVTDICGVKEGDYVFVDALARFADTYPISFINCRNIILITDSKAKTVKAPKYKVLAKLHVPNSEKDELTGFIKTTKIDMKAEIVDIGEGCEERGFKVGDFVSASDNGDFFLFGTTYYFIYDWRIPMFKYVEEE